MSKHTTHLIFSRKWTRGDSVAVWWNPDGRGYTNDIGAAGRYTREEALRIQEDSHGDSIAIAETDLERLLTRRVCDLADANNSAVIKAIAKGA